MTMTTFQKSEQHFSRFPVLYPFSEHSGIIQYHATKFEDKKQSFSVLFQLCIVPSMLDLVVLPMLSWFV